MPRRSLRSSSAANTPSKLESSPAVANSGKRSRAAPTRSVYFAKDSGKKSGKKPPPARQLSDGDGDGDGDGDDAELSAASEATIEEEASGYEDEDASASEPSSIEDDGEFDSEKSERPIKKQKRGRSSKEAQAAAATDTAPRGKGKELWRPGVKTGLGPGTEVIIDAPKARPAGSTPYRNHTIHPNTMMFLKDLAQNNDRAWLKRNDLDYRTSWNDFTAFLEAAQEKLIEIDETIPELPTKDIIFRIYRDIRFSSDPTPYKTHFSAAWSRTGRKGPFACYYMQIKPKGSFVGGGLWMPEANHLAALRRDMDRKPHKIRRALGSAGLRKYFLGNAPVDDTKTVKAFVEHNAANALKTKPKGYDADHRDIALMRLKSFTVGKKIADEDIVGDGGLGRITALFEALLPFITYLNNVVMPDGDNTDTDDDQTDEDERDSGDNSADD